MEKTESMVIAKEPTRCKLAVNDKPIPQCMLTAGRASYRGINTSPLKVKFAYKRQKTIKGVSLRDKIRSEVIRENLGIQDIVRFTKVRRRFWRDHVDRMTEAVQLGIIDVLNQKGDSDLDLLEEHIKIEEELKNKILKKSIKTQSNFFDILNDTYKRQEAKLLKFIAVEDWLSESPDFNLLDYRLCNALEQKACFKPHWNIEALKEDLVKAAASIPLQEWQDCVGYFIIYADVMHCNDVCTIGNFENVLLSSGLGRRLRRLKFVLLLEKPGRVLPAAETARQHAEQRVFEGLPEVPVEVGVDDRVQGRVEVADPEQHAYNDARRFQVAQRRYHVPETEEGRTEIRILQTVRNGSF
ncbi:hypothetical protein Trydic_g3657 [Trypoxylus dichotomus]